MSRDADLARAISDLEREWEHLGCGLVALVVRKGPYGHMVDYTCRTKREDFEAVMREAPAQTHVPPTPPTRRAR